MSGLYSITNVVDGKIYIGSAQRIEARWDAHRQQLRGGRHQNVHLQHAWRVHGESAFVFVVIETCAPDEILRQEQVALDRLFMDRPRQEIYNIARCAEAPMRGLKQSMLTSLRRSVALQGKKRSAETRARMSVAQKGRAVSEAGRRNLSASKSGTNHPNWGRHLSEETKLKIADGNRRTKALPDVRAQASASQRGRVISEEHRRRISVSKSGVNHHNWGKHLLEETKRRIGAAQAGAKHANWGKHLSEEHRRNISEALIRLNEQRTMEANRGTQ